MQNQPTAEEIINYLSGKGTDAYERTYRETLEWSDVDLERCHSQVQWVFPLHEESRHADVYPVLTPEIVDLAKKSPDILYNLVDAKRRFQDFFGIGEQEDRQKQRKWCRNGNHNLLRVTRIIRSLRLFGLDEEAREFYDMVWEVGDRLGISAITINYWDRAMDDDVWSTLLD